MKFSCEPNLWLLFAPGFILGLLYSKVLNGATRDNLSLTCCGQKAFQRVETDNFTLARTANKY
jgi:hypothetical protein